MKIFYRPIIDRIKEDVFVLDRYDLFMIRAGDDALYILAIVVLAVSIIVAYLAFDKGFKRAGWISTVIALVSLVCLAVLPSSRDKYILDIANRNSLTAEEFKLVQTKLTEEANLRVPLPKRKR